MRGAVPKIWPLAPCCSSWSAADCWNCLLDNRLLGIEAIELTGLGPNTLVVSALEVLNLSAESNNLTIRGDGDDWVRLRDAWSPDGMEAEVSVVFDVYRSGAGTLRIAQGIMVDLLRAGLEIPKTENRTISQTSMDLSNVLAGYHRTNYPIGHVAGRRHRRRHRGKLRVVTGGGRYAQRDRRRKVLLCARRTVGGERESAGR